MDFDREEIFKLIYKKDWTSLVRLLNTQGKSIERSGDEILINAIQTFIRQFINDFEKDSQGMYINHLHTIFTLHRTEIFKLSKEDFDSIVFELVRYYKDDINEAVYYAKMSPNQQLCADIIKRHKETLPKIINHSQSQTINVTKNTNIPERDYTISLFKSSQEQDFFLALRQVFPRYDVYPNVAISCLIKYELIKNHLSSQEKTLFFNGIIDCVVFDQINNYKPIYFFELDSKYHDTREQKIKDSHKDNILRIAGQKLYRVRKKSYNIGVKEFIQVIDEILSSN